MTAVTHHFGDETFRSEYFAVDGAARATIVMFPTVAGISALEQGFARDLNDKGLHVFIADVYGAQYRGCDRETGAQQMRRISTNRRELRARLLAVLDVANAQGQAPEPTICAGFCFGGLCALDIARSGANVAGVAAFHGIFDPPPALATEPITAKVIAFHGWDDPMVPPARVVGLAQELSKAGADWRILALGNTVHAFTNPGADALPNPAVAFNQRSNDRAWRSFHDFVDEIVGA